MRVVRQDVMLNAIQSIRKNSDMENKDVRDVLTSVETQARGNAFGRSGQWIYMFVLQRHIGDAQYVVAKCSECGCYYTGRNKNSYGIDYEGRTKLYASFCISEEVSLEYARNNCPPKTLWNFCPECGADMHYQDEEKGHEDRL